MKIAPKLSLHSCLKGLYEWVLWLVAIGVSVVSMIVALVCGIVAMTPVKGPADSAFYSLSGAIALTALVLFMLAGSVMLQLRMIRMLREPPARPGEVLNPPKESQR